MPKEIERKFLVKNDRWREEIESSIYMSQAYIRTASGRATIRVRIAGDQAWLTFKGPSSGISRDEFEFPVPVDEAQELIDRLCDTAIVSKVRYIVMHKGYLWEIDVFEGCNEGLVVAELELSSETENFPMPDWIGEEVTSDRRYSSGSLAVSPYSDWGK